GLVEAGRHYHSDHPFSLNRKGPGSFKEELVEVGVATSGLTLDDHLPVLTLDLLLDHSFLVHINASIAKYSRKSFYVALVTTPLDRYFWPLAVKPLYAAGFLGPLERANQRVELQVEPVALGLDLFPRGIAQDTG